jgi:hypothetical protein
VIRSIDDLKPVWEIECSPQWLIPNLLVEGSVNLITSESGTGKTWLAYFLAGAVAHGSIILGEQAIQRPVLYLDGENPLYNVKQRLFDLGIAATPALKVWGGWCEPAPTGPQHRLIAEFARRQKPLLIWDSLVEFHTGDEQSSTDTRGFMKHFRALANYGATVLVLHHTGKSESSQDYRGSSDIKAAVDMAFTLRATTPTRGVIDGLVLEPFKCRLFPLGRRALRFVRGHGFVEGEAPPAEASGVNVLGAIKAIVRSNPGQNQSQIVELASRVAISKHATEEALRNPMFRWRRGPGNSKLYFLEEEPTSSAADTEEPVDVAA